jgi:hypothetical protein
MKKKKEPSPMAVLGREMAKVNWPDLSPLCIHCGQPANNHGSPLGKDMPDGPGTCHLSYLKARQPDFPKPDQRYPSFEPPRTP